MSCNVGFNGEVFGHAFSPGRGHSLSLARIRKQPANRLGQGQEVLRIDQQPRLALFDHLGQARHSRADHGQSRRHRLQGHQGQALPAAGLNQDVRGRQHAGDVLAEAEPLGPLSVVAVANEVRYGMAFRAVAGNERADLTCLPSRQAGGLEEHADVFLPIKPTDEGKDHLVGIDPPLPSKLGAPSPAAGVGGQVDSVMDYLVGGLRQTGLVRMVVAHSPRNADDAVAPAVSQTRPGVLPRAEPSLGHVNGVDHVSDPGHPGGDPPDEVSVEQVSVKQIDTPFPESPHQAGQFQHVGLAADVQDRHAHPCCRQPIGHRPAAEGGHMDLEPLAVEPAGKFVHAPLGPGRSKLGDQLADVNSSHQEDVSARTRRSQQNSELENLPPRRYIRPIMSEKATTDRAMILAGGLGTRMQKQVRDLLLDEDTTRIADQGTKGLIPIGRPFLDHTLQALLDAGLRDFCLIVPPGASAIRRYYEAVAEQLDSGRISFAVQGEPLGTAHAVICGRDWTRDEPFLVFNSDNFYPPKTVRALMEAPAPATIAFERESLIAGSNIPADRIRRFGIINIDESGNMTSIIEKPEDPNAYAVDGKLYVSMNCFLLTREIFQACEAIPPHPQRKERELPVAVQYSIAEMGLTYAAIPSDEGVLDLTERTDIAAVRELLAGHKVRFDRPD